MPSQARPARNVAGLSPAGTAALNRTLATPPKAQSPAEIRANFTASRARAGGYFGASAPTAAPVNAARTAGS